ncbi:uncharacterized protein LOC125250320 isoform X2 [Megalobrama amblycephala]|uniref:uncharacterized protein LOC125250320 isoform X2 n=1 Tax=Megalobrama amblycephala TaxID=75352 RepID=UPI002013F990|nr:uncharacterized protein LOC125250320 isoform X2 [Megalobrama amblycephala]
MTSNLERKPQSYLMSGHISSRQQEWKAHFKELTGIDMNDSFEEATSSKFRRILEYFQFQCTERASRAGRILSKIQTGGDHVCGAVMLLLALFKNDQDQFLVIVEDTCVPNDICQEKLPPTPCIVVCGENPLTASLYMVAVDQMIVNDHLLRFTEALCLMFSLYYILNMSYPVELGATLEFLQRCIFRINPHKGTKVEKREKKRVYAVNPKVLSLTSKIAAFDWGD